MEKNSFADKILHELFNPSCTLRRTSYKRTFGHRLLPISRRSSNFRGNESHEARRKWTDAVADANIDGQRQKIRKRKDDTAETTFPTSLDVFKISDVARVQGDDRRYDVVSRQTTDEAPPRATPSPTFSGSQERSWRIRRSRNASHAGKYIITHSQATPFARSPGYKSANTPRAPPAMLATPPPTLSPAILSHSPIPVCLSGFFLYPPPSGVSLPRRFAERSSRRNFKCMARSTLSLIVLPSDEKILYIGEVTRVKVARRRTSGNVRTYAI